MEGLEEWVRERFGESAALEALGGGAWSRAWGLAAGGRELVLRVGEHRSDFLKDRVMAERAASLPVPKVWRVERFRGLWLAVSERVHGVPVDALDGAGMRAVLPVLLDLVDDISSVDISSSSGFGMWNEEERAPWASWEEALLGDLNGGSGRMPGWQDAIGRDGALAEVFRRGRLRLAQVAHGLEPRRSLVHSDLLGPNVMVQDGRITGVIDWGNAIYGVPLYDVASLLYWWDWYPAWKDIDLEGVLRRRWTEGGTTP